MTESRIPLLTTKVLVPRRRGDLVSRTRLLDALYEQIDHRLILLVAPAGYGKTSLLVDLAHHTEWSFCWYTLDVLDREPQRFLAHFIAAIAQQFPKFGVRSQAVLSSMTEGDLNLEALLGVIINDAYENINEHFVLVLDDYHLVNGSPEITWFINRFIQDVDDNCHLVLSSRTLVALPDMVLMVAHSQVSGLGVEDLAYTAPEVQALLKQDYKIELSDGQARDMVKQTEGWITGLLLSGQMIKNGMADRLRLARTNRDGLYDYLTGQVFDQQPAEIQRFLLRSALLQEFDAAFCQEVIGTALGVQDAWPEYMDYLLQQHLFIQPVGEEHIWLRYHPLFQDYLQNRMQREFPQEAGSILTHLARAYAAREEWERTYELLRRIGSSDALVEFILQAGPELLVRGRVITLYDWINALPPDVRSQNPTLLSLQGAAALMRGETHQSLEMLNAAVEQMAAGDAEAHPLAQTLTRRATLHRFLGNYTHALEDADRALDLMNRRPVDDWTLPEALRMRGMASYYLGNLREALTFLEDSLRAYLDMGDERSAAIVRMDLGLAHTTAANYLAAEEAYTRSLEYWSKVDNATWLANALNNLGDLQRLMGDYEPAISTLEKAIENARLSGYQRMEGYALTTIGDLYADLDALDQAVEAYRKARTLANHTSDQFLLVYLDLGEAMLVARQGGNFQANKMLTTARNLAQEGGSQYEQHLCHLQGGRIHLVLNEPAAAVEDFRAAAAYFSGEGQMVEALQARLFLSLALHRLGDGAAAVAEIRAVLPEVAGPSFRTALYPTLRTVRDLIEPLDSDEQLGPAASFLLQEIDRFEQTLATLRRHMRRKALSVPFAPPHLIIHALGNPLVRINDRVITGADWQVQIARDLFFFLLAHPEGVTKEMVGEAFWPDSTIGELKMRFKNNIYRLRHATGRDLILFQDEIYRFNSLLDYEYDVEQFYKEIYHAERSRHQTEKIHHYQTAIKLYQGPYLPDGEETWTLLERERIHGTYVQALLRLAALYLEQNAPDQALLCCQRVLGDDPCMEDAHRLAMKAYAVQGNRAGIVRQFELCRQVLFEEMKTTPSSNTRELYELLTR